MKIPGSVITIEDYAFAGNQLTEIDIPDSVTTIGDYAFFDNVITKVTLGAAVTSIGSGSFTEPDDVFVHYPAEYDADNFSGGYTKPIWNGYPTETLVEVEFDMNGLGVHISSLQVAPGETITPPAPTANGWSFEGWFTDASLHTPFDAAAPVTSDIVLYASWAAYNNTIYEEHDGFTYQADKTHPEAGASLIDFDGRTYPVREITGGAFGYTKLTKLQLPDSIEVLGDYAFTHYDPRRTKNMLTDLVIPDSVISIGEYAFDGGYTTPQWMGYSTQATVTATFDLNGHGDPITAQRVAHSAAVLKPSDPAETGWTFNGWYTDATLTAAFDFATPVTTDVTIVAGWTQNAPPPQPPGDNRESADPAADGLQNPIPDTGASMTMALVFAALLALAGGAVLLKVKRQP